MPPGGVVGCVQETADRKSNAFGAAFQGVGANSLGMLSLMF